MITPLMRFMSAVVCYDCMVYKTIIRLIPLHNVHHLETFRQFISTIGVQLFTTEAINVYVHIPSFATVEHFRKEQNIASH